MPLKKRTFADDEVAIFDEAVVYRRGDYWQMRMWLTKERKYARFSLKTRNRDTAIDKAKKHYHELMAHQLAGKTYFSKTTKQGVDEYLKQRERDADSGLIVRGRYGTIKTHLEHWLNFIGRDTKLKELERTDCENYLHSRTKTKKNVSVSQTTVANEQSTINAMMAWLYKRNETYIEAFDFKPLKRIDRGDETLRRASFDEDELRRVQSTLENYVKEAKASINEQGSLTKLVTAYYLLISSITGLRRGEQLQLRWSDVEWLDKNVMGGGADDTYSLVKLSIRAEITKVRKSRRFVIKDSEYFDNLFKVLYSSWKRSNGAAAEKEHFGNTLVFSVNGETPITARAIQYHFDHALLDAEVKNLQQRDLVPYSFRHAFITNMINKGATPTQVAEMCGTSTVQIERTYYHTTEAKMITNALPQFDYRDGLLVPK